MTYEGVLTKMQTEIGNPIQYYLVFENSFLNIINFMDEKLFKEVDKLPMNYPRIKLMKEYFVAAKQNLRKHIFNDWVSRCTLDIERIKDLATSL